MIKNFVSTDGKGFQITFQNGLTASVQWGQRNYCQNYYIEEQATHCRGAQCQDAEVAVWSGEKWLNACDFVSEEVSGYDVCGFMTPEQVVDFLYNVKNASV